MESVSKRNRAMPYVAPDGKLPSPRWATFAALTVLKEQFNADAWSAAALADARKVWSEGVDVMWQHAQSWSRHCVYLCGIQLKSEVAKRVHLAEEPVNRLLGSLHRIP